MMPMNYFKGIIACLNFGKVFAGFYLTREGTFGTVDQVFDCLLVGVLFTGKLDCVELISGDLHTSKFYDDVAV